MIIVGVTGNIGAGKSTVSTIIKNNTGALIIDADQITKSLLVPGEEYFDSVVKIFGEENVISQTVRKKGKVDRKLLAKAMVNDAKKREKLNKLTFKYVGAKTKELILQNQDKEFIILDFPLLYEGGFDKICNCVVGVTAEKEIKVVRLKERDNLSKEQTLAMLDIQMPEEELKEKADYIIKNNRETRYLSLVNDVIKLVHKIRKDEEEKKKA